MAADLNNVTWNEREEHEHTQVGFLSFKPADSFFHSQAPRDADGHFAGFCFCGIFRAALPLNLT